MLVERYELDVFTPPCAPGTERFSAIAHLTVDISEALPYLNATLEGALYNPNAQAVTWQHDGHKVVYSALQIAVSNVEDREEAIRLVESEIERVNQTWKLRGEIIPSTYAHQRTTPLEVYKLMPQTNCKDCGDPTCYVFATKLVAGQRELAECPELSSPAYADNLPALEGLLAGP